MRQSDARVSVFLSCRRNFQRGETFLHACTCRGISLAMFHPDGTAKYRGSSSSSSSEEKNFGWWLSHDRQIEMPSEPSEDHGSSDAFCVSADESGSYSFVRNVSRQEDEDEIGEKIELTSFAEDYLDVDLMDEGASEKVGKYVRKYGISLYMYMFARAWFHSHVYIYVRYISEA